MEINANQKVSCIVNYAYDASEPDELTVRPGDVVRDVERLPGGWWRGELRGRRGMFPDNFVSVLADHATSRSGDVQGRCRALFSYQPANPDELPLAVGDVLEVLGEVEEGWWQGRRQGRVGVFPSNFVEMVDPPQPATFEPAPALPPKPFKELCRVLFPYTAVNEDELTLAEGDIVTIVSKEAPDRGWWRGEVHGRVGLFPDNFVQLLPNKVKPDTDEKKPDRPPVKTPNVYPILNKYLETTASVKELTTSRISLHKENAINKESSTQSTVTHTNKSESDKVIHSETTTDGTLDGQIKKPPVPSKKASPTLTSSVGGLFSGLKSKMLPTEKEKSSSTTVSSGSSSGGEWDRPDGGAASKPAPAPAANVNTNANTNTNTFDHIERTQMLNDPRAGRVKAPRRRPPSQTLRDDSPHLGLSNGHEVGEKPPPEKTEEIRPRTREWEKHKAPWMAELKLNQAKKTSFGADGKSRSVSGYGDGMASKAGSGSTDRILDCGLDEKRSSSHSMEMSKSTSSISSKMSITESFEETKVRHSLDSKEVTPAPREEPTPVKPTLPSPTAAGRTLAAMLDEIKKPPAPQPPSASVRTNTDFNLEKSPNTKLEKTAPTEKHNEIKHSEIKHNEIKHNEIKHNEIKHSEVKQNEFSSFTKTSGIFEKSNAPEVTEKVEEKVPEKPISLVNDRSSAGTLERLNSVRSSAGTLERLNSVKTEKSEGTDALIAQLNNRISNLEKLIEVQNSMFNAAIEDLGNKLKAETQKRQLLQAEIEKLAHCVTQV